MAKTANLILPEQLDVEVNRFFVDRHFRKKGPDPEEGEGVAGVQRRLVLRNKTVIKGMGSNPQPWDNGGECYATVLPLQVLNSPISPFLKRNTKIFHLSYFDRRLHIYILGFSHLQLV